MSTQNFKSNIFIVLLLICLGILSRIIPHPDNFTAIGAVALFGGAYARKNNMNFIIPVLAILISNILLLIIQNKPLPNLPIQITVYLCFLLYSPIGSFFIKSIKFKNIAVGSLCGATLFFIATNFMVWLTGGYTYSFAGLIACYTAAIPFYLKMIAGDLVWCAIIFSLYELATYLLEQKSPTSISS